MAMAADQGSERREAPTRFVEMVFPEQSNHDGTLFGGHAPSLMGKAAFVAATRRARCAVVMATSDKVAFHEPLRVGERVELTAEVTGVGRSSMTVTVDMVAEAPVWKWSRSPRMAGRSAFPPPPPPFPAHPRKPSREAAQRPYP